MNDRGACNSSPTPAAFSGQNRRNMQRSVLHHLNDRNIDREDARTRSRELCRTYNCAVSRAKGFVKRMTCECQFKDESLETSAVAARVAEPIPAYAAAATTMEESAAASAAAAVPTGLLHNFRARSYKNKIKL